MVNTEQGRGVSAINYKAGRNKVLFIFTAADHSVGLGVLSELLAAIEI